MTKRVIGTEQVGATFNVTVELVLENTGTTRLSELTLTDDLSAELTPHAVSVVSSPVIGASNATADPTINAAFDSDPSQNIFESFTGFLDPGTSITVRLTFNIEPDFNQLADGKLVIANQAEGGGIALDETGSPMTDDLGNPMAPVTDLSDSGDDPNSNNPGAPGDTGGFDDATSTNLEIFAYDSFRNFSIPDTDEDEDDRVAEESDLEFLFVDEADVTEDPTVNNVRRAIYKGIEIKKPHISLERIHFENQRPLGNIGEASDLSLEVEHIFDDRRFNDEQESIDDVLTLYLTEGDNAGVDEGFRNE